MRLFLKSMDLATAQLAIAKLLGNARLSCSLPPADSLNQNRADLPPPTIHSARKTLWKAIRRLRQGGANLVPTCICNCAYCLNI